MVRTILLLFLAFYCTANAEYEPTWKSLDTRPLPSWYDEAKIGIFIHWGVFSVPSFGSEWFWKDWVSNKKPFVDFMQKNYKPGFSYQEFAPQFTAEFFNPDDWADMFKAAGAKYIVMTSKHHEGFTLWGSPVSWGWNSVDVGPRRDLIGDMAKSLRSRTDLKFGIYHSLYEWYNPLYKQDQLNNYATNDFVTRKTMPELYELVNTYKPEVIWSDGDWEAPDTYWNSTGFIAWLYNSSPVKDTVVTNDRWGINIMCHHGDFYTCSDRYNPGVLQKHKWENCMTLDKESWGFRREAKLADFLTIESLIGTLAETISCGGNLLLNVGPTSYGRITPIFEERLRQMGDWLKVNGEAIYSSKPWSYQNDTLTSNVWYTSKQSGNGVIVYAMVLFWPKDNTLTLAAPVAASDTKITLIGYDKPLQFSPSKTGMKIEFPALNSAQLPCKWAWVLKLESLSPISHLNDTEKNGIFTNSVEGVDDV